MTLDGDLTHVATVQSWECDSNGHLNVQFFHQRFREAGAHYRMRHGLSGTPMVSAHTRFHRELYADDMARVFTLPVRGADGAVYLMHRLTADGRSLSCSTLDRLTGDAAGLSPRPLSEFPEVAPRGLPAGPGTPLAATEPLIASGRALVSCITHVLPSDLDHTGAWRAERLLSSFSNGGQLAWSLIGAEPHWLRERGLGRVVLEMKLDCLRSPAAGAVLRQTSHALELGTKTYRFAHQIEDAISGECLAVGEVVSILLDHASRKSVAFPPDLAIAGG
ncbi:MAG: hypothetical protein R3D85_02720 [Paracoccaceae bacterium]